MSPLDPVFIAAISIVGVFISDNGEEEFATRVPRACVSIWFAAAFWCRPLQGSGNTADIASDKATTTDMPAKAAGFLRECRALLFRFGGFSNMVPRIEN